ncbi:MAG: hypothetical protein JWN75_977 [Candidatus Saccharibacteria bacterium]|nr:hypothetical protein [Candidatus Saccharibacteria bacterium]
MQEITEKKYHSVWDEIQSWGDQGSWGKIKLVTWVAVVLAVFIGIIPSLLAPLYDSDLGAVPAVIIYVAIVITVQMTGSRLKLEIKNKSKR